MNPMDLKVHQLYGHRVIPGEVGIEIELEGENVTAISAPGWKSEHDGSLRGEAVELVLKKPVARSDVREYVSRIVRSADAVNAVPVDTGRAGVHLHINVQDLTVKQLFNFICAYIIFETPCIDFCGNHRVGNLFCLRVQDAEYLLNSISESLKGRDFWSYRDNIRYAAMNLTSLKRYGSLEFRSMRSTIDPDYIHKWMSIITKIKDWSLQFDNPQEIIQEFSIRGPEDVFLFLKEEGLSATHDVLYEGVRYAQEIAFATNWDFSIMDDMEEIKQEMPKEHPLRDFIGNFSNELQENFYDNPQYYLMTIAQIKRDACRPVLGKRMRIMERGRNRIVDEVVQLEDVEGEFE